VVDGCTNVERVRGGCGGGGGGGSTKIGRDHDHQGGPGEDILIHPDKRLEHPQHSEVGVRTAWAVHVQEQG
jgi:hypothetical protein